MKISFQAVLALAAASQVSAGCVGRRAVSQDQTSPHEAEFIANQARERRLKTERKLQGNSGIPLTPPFRSFDGSDTLAPIEHELLRMTPAVYADNAGALRPGPNPRLISTLVHDDDGSGGLAPVSDMFWQYAQFLDHDVALSEPDGVSGTAPIACPAGADPGFCTTGDEMPFDRTHFEPVGGVREHPNELTAVVDGSNVYGNDDFRATMLREGAGGRLLVSDNNLLPLNAGIGLPNAGEGDFPGAIFVGGDIRVNEQLGLAAMHTLFVREHNRLAEIIATRFGKSDDEEIYQLARKIVIGELQAITYKEFLPLLVGNLAPNPEDYSFDPSIDPGLNTEFSTACYRFGHTMISPDIRLQRTGNPQDFSTIALVDAFFASDLMEANPLLFDDLMGGLINQNAQALDRILNDDIRNTLFRRGFTDGSDLASFNIQRGRDHGLATYNVMRGAYGLSPLNTFEDMGADAATTQALATAYTSVDDIDAFVGGLSEPPANGGLIGEMCGTVIAEQFDRIMNGDPFFYTGDEDLTNPRVRNIVDVHTITLGDIIRLNSKVDIAVGDKVFEGIDHIL